MKCGLYCVHKASFHAWTDKQMHGHTIQTLNTSLNFFLCDDNWKTSKFSILHATVERFFLSPKFKDNLSLGIAQLSCISRAIYIQD